MSGEGHDVGLTEALVSADESNKLMTVDAGPLENRAADDSVEPWCVTATGENSNLHTSIVAPPPSQVASYQRYS